MARISFWSALWRNLLNRGSVEADLDSEVQAYFDTLLDRYTAQRLSIEEARRAVRQQFGGPDQVKENVREVRAGAVIDATFQDLRDCGALKSSQLLGLALHQWRVKLVLECLDS